MRLEGKVALISGAGGPMGAAIARRFAVEGTRLVLCDISGPRIDAVAAELGSHDFITGRANATDTVEMNALMNRALDRFGSVDIIINVVGGIRKAEASGPLLTAKPSTFLDTLDFNTAGILLSAQRLVPGMMERGWGRIINISSAAMSGLANMASYGAAKAAVASLTRTMAIEFAPHVTVNSIAPSLINTGAVAQMSQKQVDQYLALTLLRRLGEPEDVANAALFLASDESSFITGINLPVSGGLQVTL